VNCPFILAALSDWHQAADEIPPLMRATKIALTKPPFLRLTDISGMVFTQRLGSDIVCTTESRDSAPPALAPAELPAAAWTSAGMALAFARAHVA